MTELDRLKAENIKLRKILAHVPARIALKAKEDAGFGEPVKPRRTIDAKLAERVGKGVA